MNNHSEVLGEHNDFPHKGIELFNLNVEYKKTHFEKIVMNLSRSRISVMVATLMS